jgi:hypothetical protein
MILSLLIFLFIIYLITGFIGFLFVSCICLIALVFTVNYSKKRSEESIADFKVLQMFMKKDVEIGKKDEDPIEINEEEIKADKGIKVEIQSPKSFSKLSMRSPKPVKKSPKRSSTPPKGILKVTTPPNYIQRSRSFSETDVPSLVLPNFKRSDSPSKSVKFNSEFIQEFDKTQPPVTVKTYEI